MENLAHGFSGHNPMNILIDVNHPAQVHYFRNLYHELSCKHKVLLTTKDIPMQTRLLKAYDVPYITYGAKSTGLAAKALKQIRYDLQCYGMLREHNIDIAWGASVSNVHASLFGKTVSIATTDSDLAVLPLAAKFVYPLADYVMTPDALAFQKMKKQLCYPSYQELAYLHPKRFKPDPGVLHECGIAEMEPYFILRFTAFKAHHDIGMYGLSREQKKELINTLEDYGRVFITSEVDDPLYRKYALPVSPEKIHSLLYYAGMLVCDSQTMTTEAAILGTPAFRCNTFAGKLTVIEEIEKKYDLAFSYHPRHFDWMMKKIRQVLSMSDAKAQWAEKRSAMLNDKIDVTSFWVWFLDNFPESAHQVRQGRCDFDVFRGR